ncbi:MAG TPA: ATP-grasp domain-containing protein [Sphingomonas sp.]|nr:ATP-grasp domain-containing protein [Sphingomonas sp.]
MRRDILLLSAGRRVELLEGFRSAAQHALPGARVLAADMRPALSAACQAADGCFALPPVGASDYADALADLCARETIGLVVPTIDTELATLARLREGFEAEGTQLVISDPVLVDACRDKAGVGALFDRLGLATPALMPRDALRFPCFTKPRDGSSSIGATRLDGPEELSQAMRDDPDRLFMDLVPPDHVEVTVDLYYARDHTLKAVIPRQRIETRGGEVSKGITRRDWLHDLLRAKLARLDGARGCLTLQLFVPPAGDRVLAIEINPRFGGGFPLALAAGADFPAWLIGEYLLGETVDWFDGWEDRLVMLRYDAKVLVHGG